MKLSPAHPNKCGLTAGSNKANLSVPLVSRFLLLLFLLRVPRASLQGSLSLLEDCPGEMKSNTQIENRCNYFMSGAEVNFAASVTYFWYGSCWLAIALSS